MEKKLVKLTEGDLHRIVKESVKKIMQEAYGTPTRADDKRLSYLDDAGGLGGEEELRGTSADNITKKIAHISGLASELHYTAMALGDEYDRYSTILDNLAQKIDYVATNMSNQEQMKTGEQPRTMNNFRYMKRRY